MSILTEINRALARSAGPWDSFLYLNSDEELDLFKERLAEDKIYDESCVTVWNQSQMQKKRSRFEKQFPKALRFKYFVVLDHY